MPRFQATKIYTYIWIITVELHYSMHNWSVKFGVVYSRYVLSNSIRCGSASHMGSYIAVHYNRVYIITESVIYNEVLLYAYTVRVSLSKRVPDLLLKLNLQCYITFAKYSLKSRNCLD